MNKEGANSQDSGKNQHQSIVVATTGLALLLAVLIFVAFVAGWLGSKAAQDNGGQSSGATSEIEAANDGNNHVTTQEASIAAVVETAGKSVVSISSQTADYSRGQLVEGAGTGMIISKDGYIMTNKHVVGSARTVTVTTESGDVYSNTSVVGIDKLNDIAFLKIPNVNNMPYVTLGNSSTLRVGQGVIAIGNALGQFKNTVTSGIISGKGRPITAQGAGGAAESLVDLLQTDAAINSGNSGGPLLNLDGQVVGINTAIAADAQNIGFAIPISSAKGMIKELLETGKVKRAYLGVRYVSITPEVKEQYNLNVKNGDLITSSGGSSAVVSDGPAASADLRDKDIIIKVGDQSVMEGNSVATIVGQYRPGETVKLTILRGGKEIVKEIKLGSY
ncbi:trypsin-like peptidase domain-containing protein [Candidatus Nomurabacteria bacterium]|nr:trypsin-like peptidase domain-containing protein [Candidatus Nomurabacteria bacterium]